MAIALRYAVRSDKGLVRGNNEDSVYAGPRLLAIADGMGGHAAGEVASTTVITALERLDEDHPIPDLLGELRSAFEQANRDVADAIDADSALDGMGTTLTALRFVGSRVGLVHVGDSRAYLARGGSFAQITHDDTYVQSLVDSGKLTVEEAATHPRKSVILRAITGTDVEPDVSIREARIGDRYLLCSDGLSDVVTAQTIAEAIAEGTPQECADRLVELALRGGGPDNVTCIVADVVDSDGAGWNDDLPVIGGALDVNDGANESRADRVERSELSAAERAAALGRSTGNDGELGPPGSADGGPAGRRRRGRRARTWVIAVGVVVVVVAAGVGTYLWTQTQYYVGESGLKVAIFRGVNTDVGPLRFSQVEVSTDLVVKDLTVVARDQVRGGITATSRNDAQEIVDRLDGELLPACPEPVSTGTGSPGSGTPTAGDTAATTPGSTPAAPTSAAPGSSAPSTPASSPAEQLPSGSTASTGTTSPSGSSSSSPSALRTGIDCRAAS